jgi:hypothetical protein
LTVAFFGIDLDMIQKAVPNNMPPAGLLSVNSNVKMIPKKTGFDSNNVEKRLKSRLMN